MKKYIEKIESAFWVMISICFLVFVYAPLEMFFNNQNEFWFDLSVILPYVLILFLVGVVIGSLFCILCGRSKALLKIFIGFEMVILFATYIQGTFLVEWLPELDGADVDWEAHSMERYKTIALWIVLALAVGFLIKYFKEQILKIAKYIGICAFGFFLISVSILGITTYKWPDRNDMNLRCTTDGFYEWSAESNVIVLMVDAVDATVFSDVLEHDQNLQNSLDGFTYYDNVMGSYPYTLRAVPFILSGIWREDYESPSTWSGDMIRDSLFLKELEEQNYKLALYDEEIIFGSADRYINIHNCKDHVKSKSWFARCVVKMAGVKYAPFDLKRYCYNLPQRLKEVHQILDENGNVVEIYDWNDYDYYRNLQNEKFDKIDEKLFKWIHIEGAHAGFHLDRNVDGIEHGTYKQKVEATGTIINLFLNKLKENDLYDNSIIMIMSDHGYADAEDGEGRQNPILLVKGLKENHDLELSDKSISQHDYMEMYERLLNGDKGNEVFDWINGDERDRRYMIYGHKAYTEEYMQYGHASDMSTLIPTGKQYEDQ